MKEVISITGMASVSALGRTLDQVWSEYNQLIPVFSQEKFNFGPCSIGELRSDAEVEIENIRQSNPFYRRLDRTVLLSIYASRKAIAQTGWNSESKQHVGINIGSSRGATRLFERYYDEFKNDVLGKASVQSSPGTTLGNISSWVANDLGTTGVAISHSVTCSTALHAVLNGVAWINSGMTGRFIAGGSEAANTGFTIAQLKALKIYSTELNNENFPCRSMDFEKTKNTMILSEGAASLCLEKGEVEGALAKITGIGFGTEQLSHGASISTEAECFQKSMRMAVESAGLGLQEIDVVVMHAPGTVKGDRAELNAINAVFGTNERIPALTSNKWKIGHTLGASGAISMEFAIMMLQNNRLIESPFYPNARWSGKIQHILVNAVGFGGNAVSIILSK